MSLRDITLRLITSHWAYVQLRQANGATHHFRITAQAMCVQPNPRGTDMTSKAIPTPGKGLLTPSDHILVMVDHQSQMAFAT
jgi:hypothetical protein